MAASALLQPGASRAWLPLLSLPSVSSSSASSQGGSLLLLPAVLQLPGVPAAAAAAALLLSAAAIAIAAAGALSGGRPRAAEALLRLLCALFDWLQWRLCCLASALSPASWLSGSASHPHAVYLLGLSTFTPPADWECDSKRFTQVAAVNFSLPRSSVALCERILAKSGLGERTAFPRQRPAAQQAAPAPRGQGVTATLTAALPLAVPCSAGILQSPPRLGLSSARAEASFVLLSCLDALFAQHPELPPSAVGMVISCCSLFAPTPSLSSLVVNRYRMRADVQSYSLAGMGCSAGVLSLHLARELLQLRPGSLCLVLATETITQSIYCGAEPSMLISNALFRCGGAALLLSNRPSERWLRGRARCSLRWTARTHCAADDAAYGSVFQQEDGDGHRGVRIGKELMEVAARGLALHLQAVGHRLLARTEIAALLLSIALAAVTRRLRRPAQAAKARCPSLGAALLSSAVYSPCFSSPSLHPCIHGGGSGVLSAIQSALRLTDADVAVSRQVLHRYGNVSSASVFYQLQLLLEPERAGRGDGSGGGEQGAGEAAEQRPAAAVRRGHQLWLLAFGSGFKISSAVFDVL